MSQLDTAENIIYNKGLLLNTFALRLRFFDDLWILEYVMKFAYAQQQQKEPAFLCELFMSQKR